MVHPGTAFRRFDTDSDTSGGGHFYAIRSLLPYLWPRGYPGLKVRVVAAVALLVAAKVSIIFVPFLYKGAVDAFDGDAVQVVAVPIVLILAYGVARIASQAFGQVRDAVFINVSQHAIRTVALATFRHLHSLSLRFHLERQTGGLSRVIERGTKAIMFILNFTLFNILPTLVEIALVCIILLANYTFWIALITFVSVIAYIAFTVLVTEWRIKFRREMNRTDNEAMTRAIDSLINYETVKYFGNEPHEAGRFDTSLANYQRAAVTSHTTLALLNIGQGVLMGIGLVGVMLFAARGVVAGTMTVGDFVLVNTFLIQLYQPLGFLGFVYREIKQSLVDMEKMFELLEIRPEIRDRAGAAPLRVTAGELTFDDVSFSYDPRRPILRNLSFHVPEGSTIAVVGHSGAGKSTISRILFRFYDADSGSVAIDGQDIRDMTQDSVRAAIGIVPQDTVLFNDTIAYNIRYGRVDATDQEIEEAAKLAQIHEFVVAQPDGYQTVVGERGLKISGGEKQRVAIARAILKRPRILVFDEATSALDTKTEKEIQVSLREISANRTTLVIAHRLSTVVDADEILVLDDGQVIERGRHADLLAAGRTYAQMWARQQEADERQRLLAEEFAEA